MDHPYRVRIGVYVHAIEVAGLGATGVPACGSNYPAARYVHGPAPRDGAASGSSGGYATASGCGTAPASRPFSASCPVRMGHGSRIAIWRLLESSRMQASCNTPATAFIRRNSDKHSAVIDGDRDDVPIQAVGWRHPRLPAQASGGMDHDQADYRADGYETVGIRSG